MKILDKRKYLGIDWRSVKILEIICMNAWYLSSYAMRTTNFAKLIIFLLLRQVGIPTYLGMLISYFSFAIFRW
jgi:hypothetical protein